MIYEIIKPCPLSVKIFNYILGQGVWLIVSEKCGLQAGCPFPLKAGCLEQERNGGPLWRSHTRGSHHHGNVSVPRQSQRTRGFRSSKRKTTRKSVFSKKLLVCRCLGTFECFLFLLFFSSFLHPSLPFFLSPSIPVSNFFFFLQFYVFSYALPHL